MTFPNRVFVNPDIARCFDSILDFLRSGDAPSSTLPILAAHNSRDCPDSPPEYILFNTEQLTRAALLEEIVAASASPSCKEVWDYSAANVSILATHGVVARHVPMWSSQEYRATLRRYREEEGVLYDFGFCGALSPRRLAVLDALQAAGKTVGVAQCFGEARDRILAASRIHLNIHYAADYQVFESNRCNPWLDIGVPVVSEPSLDDDPRCMIASYDQMVSFCLDLPRELA